jgi:ubiquinone/menaquinone biosynthesis C-methylase UbiE
LPNGKYKVPPDWYDKAVVSFNIFHRFWHLKRMKVLANLLSRFDGLILDVGCDGGTISDIFKQDDVWIVGIDIDVDAIRYASVKRRCYAWVLADAHYLPFKKESFDVVLCIEVLEHCYSPRNVMEEIERVSRSEVLVLIPNSASRLFRIIWGIWLKLKGRVWIGSHLHEFNNVIAERLFSSCGFKVLLLKKTLLSMLLVYKLKKYLK